jgi:hypothetical protein
MTVGACPELPAFAIGAYSGYTVRYIGRSDEPRGGLGARGQGKTERECERS